MAIIDELRIIVVAEVEKAIANLNKTEKAAKEAGTSFKDLAKQIAGYTTAAGLIVDVGKRTITWLSNTAKEAISLAASFEQTRMSFGAMLADMDRGEQFFSQIQQFAYTTPLSLSGTTKAAQTLLGFGVEAENMVAVLGKLGDAARGNDERLTHLALVYGQVKAQTRALTQDLYQFVNSGVPIFQLLADSMGKTAGEIKALAPLGKITFEEIDKAITKATDSGGLFYNLMDTVAQSTQGQWQIAVDNWQYSLSQIGNSVLPIATAALNAFNSMFKYTNNEMEKFGSTVNGLTALKKYEYSLEPNTSQPKTLDAIKEVQKELLTNINLGASLKNVINNAGIALGSDIIDAYKVEYAALIERNSALSAELIMLRKRDSEEKDMALEARRIAKEKATAAALELRAQEGLAAGQEAYNKSIATSWRNANLEGRSYLELQDYITAKTEQYNTSILSSDGAITSKNLIMQKLAAETAALSEVKDSNEDLTKVYANEEERRVAQYKAAMDSIAKMDSTYKKESFDALVKANEAEIDATRSINEKEDKRKLEAYSDLMKSRLAMDDAYRKQQKTDAEKAEEARKKEIDDAVDAYQRYTSAIGEALVSGEEGWEKYNKIVRGGIADMIEAFGKEAMIRAAVQFATGNWGGGAALVAAAGVAFAGSAAVRAMAQGGEGTVTKPTLFLAGEAGPEDYSFRPKSKGGLGASPIIINQYIAGSVLAERQLGELAVGAVAKARRGY